MKEITHKQLKELMKITYQKRLALYIWGGIGIGKSQTVRETVKDMANELKLKFNEELGEIDNEDTFSFVDVRMSQLEPSDIRGLPKITDEKTKWILPDWLPRNSKSKGILFFDELNLATPSIQASAYQLILDRRINSYVLPDGWVIMSAGNRLEDRANVFDLPSPLSNRFIHIELKVPSVEEWTLWAIPNNMDSRILAFLHFKPSYMYKFNANDKAFPTPRTYEFCSRLIKDVTDLTQIEILTSSALGEAVSIEMSAFIKLSSKIKVSELLDNPKMIKDIKEVALKWTITTELAEIFKHDSKKFDKIMKVIELLEAEFSVLTLRLMKAVNSKVFSKEAVKFDFLKNYAKYLL